MSFGSQPRKIRDVALLETWICDDIAPTLVRRVVGGQEVMVVRVQQEWPRDS